MVLFWFMFITKMSYASPVSQGYKLGYDTCPKSVSGSMVVNCSMFLILCNDQSKFSLLFISEFHMTGLSPPPARLVNYISKNTIWHVVHLPFGISC